MPVGMKVKEAVARNLRTSSLHYTTIMSESVSLASALLTLVVFAFDVSKSLYEVVSTLKSQRQTMSRMFSLM